MLSDCLTKKGGNSTLTREVMTSGAYGIGEEAMHSLLRGRGSSMLERAFVKAQGHQGDVETEFG